MNWNCKIYIIVSIEKGHKIYSVSAVCSTLELQCEDGSIKLCPETESCFSAPK